MSTRSLSGVTATTARLHLRPIVASDEDAYVGVLERSRETWEPWTPAAQADLAPGDRFRKELDRSVRGAAAGTHLRLGAFLREGVGAVGGAALLGSHRRATELVALVALNEIVRGVFMNGYVSWQVDAAREGRGFGSEAVRALLDLALRAGPAGVGLHRVQANIMPSNVRSIRLAERIGFRREGLALRYLEIAGAWEDHVMYALTAEDWPVEGRG